MYTFYCAQLEGEQTKHKLTDNTRKRCARMTMDQYQCDGWLHVTVNESDLSIVCIYITHYCWHHPYMDISILDDIAEEIEKLKDLPAAKVSEILPTLEGNDLMVTQDMVGNRDEQSKNRDNTKTSICTLGSSTRGILATG